MKHLVRILSLICMVGLFGLAGTASISAQSSVALSNIDAADVSSSTAPQRAVGFVAPEKSRITSIRLRAERTGSIRIAIFNDDAGRPGTEVASFGTVAINGTAAYTFNGSFVVEADTTYWLVAQLTDARMLFTSTAPTGTFSTTTLPDRYTYNTDWSGTCCYLVFEISAEPFVEQEVERPRFFNFFVSFFDRYPGFNDSRLLPNLASRINAYRDWNGRLRIYYKVNDWATSEIVTHQACDSNTRSLLSRNRYMELWCLESNEYQVVDLNVFDGRRDNLIISNDGQHCRRTYFFVLSMRSEDYDWGCRR